MRQTISSIMTGLMAISGLAFFAGCEVHEEAPPPPAATVYVTPGYYYDEEYIDVNGVHHPRAYYYWDGHNWDHRDRVPDGYVAHVRVQEEHQEKHPDNGHHW
jgi:hypothetical protein